MTNDCKYHYALDEHNQTVFINDVSDEDKKLHKYHCIGCNTTMIPRRGKVREWHFAHKCDEEHNCFETYLHELSKTLVKKNFDNSDTFKFSYYQNTEYCLHKQNCAFFDDDVCCKKSELQTYDLKDYYDTCTIEQPIDNFKADLLLTNSKNNNIKPTLIEIQVTHKCDEAKIASRYRIIELRIRNEKDIEDLLKTTFTEKYKAKKDTDNIGFAKFHNFIKRSIETEPLEKIKTNRFYMFEDGSSYVEPVSCASLNKKYPENVFEAFFDECDMYSTNVFGRLLAIQQKAIKGFCRFCKYYKDIDNYWTIDKFCCLYKKFGTPQYPEQTQALQCKYYREDKEYMGFLKMRMPKYIIAK